MLNTERIEAFYSYFFKKRYNVSKYNFKSTKTTQSVCGSFLDLIDKEYSLLSIEDHFLWEYFLFQWQYWEDCTSLANKFSDKVVVAWIVGKKAFDRWKNRDKDFDWQIDSYPIIKKYGLDKKDLVKTAPNTKIKLHDSSKAIRKQHLNTERGFAMCVEFTTLFNPLDVSCIRCNSRADCKELLRVNFPNLYNQRGLTENGK